MHGTAGQRGTVYVRVVYVCAVPCALCEYATYNSHSHIHHCWEDSPVPFLLCQMCLALRFVQHHHSHRIYNSIPIERKCIQFFGLWAVWVLALRARARASQIAQRTPAQNAIYQCDKYFCWLLLFAMHRREALGPCERVVWPANTRNSHAYMKSLAASRQMCMAFHSHIHNHNGRRTYVTIILIVCVFVFAMTAALLHRFYSLHYLSMFHAK